MSMGTQDGDGEPRSVEFQIQGRACYLAEIAQGIWALNMRLAVVSFDSVPSLDIVHLEADRFRVHLDNVWFDTDEISAQKISQLVKGQPL